MKLTPLSHKMECERDMIHALFTCLAFLAKGQNKTSNWITSRFKRVQENMSGVTDLDSAVIQEFDKRYSGNKLTNAPIFKALAAAYKCLDDTPANSLDDRTINGIKHYISIGCGRCGG